MNANSLTCLLAALLCVGCAHFQENSAEQPARWEVRRNGWFDKIKASPEDSQRAIVNLINFSTSYRVDGDENRVHGQILSEVKKLAGAGWKDGLLLARRDGMESSLVLVDAYESGQGFSYSPPVVVLRRAAPGGLGDRAISLDLSD